MEIDMSSIEFYERQREQLVEDAYQRMLEETLTDIAAFEALDSGYEICAINSGQIQRALRNLGDAVNGKEHARDAVFTALGYVMGSLKTVLREQADAEIVSAGEMQFDDRRVA